MSEKRPITPAGFKKFQDELHTLWHVDRPKIVNEVSDAAALGDRSENAEYIYGKKKLREIDKRIGFLTDLLENKLIPIDPKTQASSVVKFGATVVVEDEEGEERTYQIVGRDEVDGKLGRISMDSPIGKSLMNKKRGDSVLVIRPAGELELTIQEIRYE
ncbi:transcription elongation factor GreB [Myxococcota bacterium]|nr:transcription elongation factor GreB [Myxococcota bacterium]